MTYDFDQLTSRYELYTNRITCECVLATEMVGGQPAGEDGVRAFVVHQLKIDNPEEQQRAVQRILKEEIEDVTPPLGEISEKKVYGVRVLRRHDGWPWIGPWMVKACMKQASSGLDVYRQIWGSKKAMAEAGRVRALGASLRDPKHPEQVYITNPEGDGPPETYWKEFMGRVSSSNGMVNIIHWSECVAPGSRFHFDFRFMPLEALTEAVIVDVVALAMQVGLGSARSLERGKFRIERCEVEMTKEYRAKPEQPKRDKKAKKSDKPNGKEEQEPTVKPETYDPTQWDIT